MKDAFLTVAVALCVITGVCSSFLYAQGADLRSLSIDELTARIGTEPRNDDLYRMRALKHAAAGRFFDAASDATRAVETGPGNPENWYRRGLIYLTAGMFEQTISDFTRVLELSPGSKHGYKGLFHCYTLMKEFDKALAYAEKLVELEPENYESYIDRAMMRVATQDIMGSIADLDRAIELNPHSAYAFSLRGSTYVRMLGEYEKALSDFDTAIRFDASYADAWSGRAYVHYRRKNYQKSIDDATTYLRLASKPDWRTVAGRGMAYEALAEETKDEKQKAELQKKAEADYARARELGWDGVE
jgi:tetratricopeptide (TPR) repeat protein